MLVEHVDDDAGPRPGGGELVVTDRADAQPAVPALAETTGNDAYELQRRLGHQSQRYINRYTNPPEDIAAGDIEQM